MAILRTLQSVIDELTNKSENDDELVLDDDVALIDGLPSLDDKTLAAWLAMERAMASEALELTRES
jgi:hypothetical protein